MQTTPGYTENILPMGSLLENIKRIIYIIIILTIIRQSIFSFLLLYYDYIRYNDDINLSNYIIDLNKKYPDKQTILVGAYHNNKNVKLKGETLGHSFASWDYLGEYGVNNRMISFMNVQKLKPNMASIEVYSSLKDTTSDKYYPNKGCYKTYDDYIVVYLR